MRFITLCIAALFTLPFAAMADTLPEDRSSAVVLSYSRIGEDAYTATNLRKDQFEAHLNELKSERYNVMALPDILAAIENQTPLPSRTVAITFSGAFKSAYENAMPLLIEAGIPFTVFYASGHADSDATQHLNWKDLKRLKESGYTSFGLLPASYTRLSGQSNEEILRQINKARTRHREELKSETTLFAYPFGEYSARYKSIIEEQGFKSAFGLHSGALHASADMFALPRFPMTEGYGSVDRFSLVSSALPLPATEIEPQDPYLENGNPSIGFTVTQSLSKKLSALTCFVSGQGEPALEQLGENRIELRLKEPLSEERTRVNCTVPEGKDNWRWLGMLLVHRNVSGETTATELSIPQQGVLP